ncbi:MAG: hypothetical protein Q4G08_05035 [Capnocytophaga sp.]|nr:hypothetical protein [Capnocytophaga sp.]
MAFLSSVIFNKNVKPKNTAKNKIMDNNGIGWEFVLQTYATLPVSTNDKRHLNRKNNGIFVF